MNINTDTASKFMVHSEVIHSSTYKKAYDKSDALVSKAISNNAIRTTDEIHEYIAAMSDVGSAV